MDSLVKKGKWNIIVRTQGRDNQLELKNALYSIIAQDYENKSIIIIIHSDKESIIRNTEGFIKNFQSLIEIKTIVAREKQNVRSYPLNLGLQNIDGEYVSFLDHDDIYYPNMGSLLIEKLTEGKRSFAFGDSVEVEQSKVTDFSGKKYLYTKNKNHRERTKFNKLYLLLDNFIPFNSFVMRTSLVGETTFDERLEFLEDWDFLKKISLKEEFSVYQLKKPVSEYRRRYDETDTYNKKAEKRWRKARKITDNNVKGSNITANVEEVLDLRKEYIKQIRRYEEAINHMSKNTGYRVWERLKKNRIISYTFVRWVRELRHKLKD